MDRFTKIMLTDIRVETEEDKSDSESDNTYELLDWDYANKVNNEKISEDDVVVDTFSDVFELHNRIIAERLEEAEMTVKKVFLDNQDCINVVDTDYLGTAHYNSLSKEIRMNYLADTENLQQPGSTYFHEVGHAMDDFLGYEDAWLSDDSRFNELLREDFSEMVNFTMSQNDCDLESAYETISEQIWDNEFANVSDIYGSLSSGKCQGSWGHDVIQWEMFPSKISKEAFANMFETSFGNANKKDIMEQYLPKSYSRFLEIMKGVN